VRENLLKIIRGERKKVDIKECMCVSEREKKIETEKTTVREKEQGRVKQKKRKGE